MGFNKVENACRESGKIMKNMKKKSLNRLAAPKSGQPGQIREKFFVDFSYLVPNPTQQFVATLQLQLTFITSNKSLNNNGLISLAVLPLCSGNSATLVKEIHIFVLFSNAILFLIIIAIRQTPIIISFTELKSLHTVSQ